MKKRVLILLITLLPLIGSCGVSVRSLATAVASRLIVGAVTGDFTGIISAAMTNTVTGSVVTSAVTNGAFSMSVSRGASYVLSLNKSGSGTVTAHFPKATASAVYTDVFNVTAPTATSGDDIDLGNIAYSSASTANFVATTNNPLSLNDLDGDGLSDFDDNDDDGDGITDSSDTDDNNDGKPDSTDEQGKNA